MVVIAEADDAAGCAAAAEEGGDRRGWPTDGGCHAAAAASRQAGCGICVCLAFFPPFEIDAPGFGLRASGRLGRLVLDKSQSHNIFIPLPSLKKYKIGTVSIS